MYKKSNSSTTFYVVLIAMFSALICALTALLQIPLPIPNGLGGYINFGDALIFLSASLLGPLGGAVSGAVGSSLADIFTGSGIYAPFTFVVKGGEGFLVGILYMYVFKNRAPFIRRLVPMLVAGVWVMVGYFLTDIILGVDARVSAINNFGLGALQPAVSIVIALLIMPRLPVLFESVKYHTENDDEDLYESEVLQGSPDKKTDADEQKTDISVTEVNAEELPSGTQKKSTEKPKKRGRGAKNAVSSPAAPDKNTDITSPETPAENKVGASEENSGSAPESRDENKAAEGEESR